MKPPWIGLVSPKVKAIELVDLFSRRPVLQEDLFCKKTCFARRPVLQEDLFCKTICSQVDLFARRPVRKKTCSQDDLFHEQTGFAKKTQFILTLPLGGSENSLANWTGRVLRILMVQSVNDRLRSPTP